MGLASVRGQDMWPVGFCSSRVLRSTDGHLYIKGEQCVLLEEPWSVKDWGCKTDSSHLQGGDVVMIGTTVKGASALLCGCESA